MTTPSGSTDVKPDVKKEENSNQQWAVQIATSVVEAIDEKKEDSSKGPAPEPYEGDHKDTMNPSRANTDEKKKMILLSFLKGKTTDWKTTEQERLFPEDDDPEEKKKAAKETWSTFKNRFRKHWQPVDVAGDAQMRIRDLQMKERADNYVNQFRLLASQTGYDDIALITFFKEGLVPSLQDKIMLRPEGPPKTIDKWYEIAIRYNNQYRGEEDSDEVRINAKLSTSQVLAQAHEVKLKSLEELIPPYLSDYTNRFEKKKSERFPPSRPYDHAIDLKPDFKPRDCKVYSLSPKERIEQDKFLDENLQKGYIRPSKSPMASPFFFVSKKEAGALRPCQDYRDLNNGTIKNQYPLPLVTDLVDKLKMARVFTKLDLQNGYNNI
uniref:Retrotransposon gag domain-containing protein n=2 Tax=Moniliophthora roreri TaxID=221103 RepID=A0A0W0GFQ9_MONRR